MAKMATLEAMNQCRDLGKPELEPGLRYPRAKCKEDAKFQSNPHLKVPNDRHARKYEYDLGQSVKRKDKCPTKVLPTRLVSHVDSTERRRSRLDSNSDSRPSR